MAISESTWTPSSWRELPAGQQPEWPDSAALAAVRERLHLLPPLVFAGEARALLAALGEVCEGRAFLLQAGDCVESFRDISAPALREKLKVMLQMSAVLTYGATLPVIRVGRIAGQFAKPRSRPTEIVDGVELPSFRGHVVHSDEPTPEARVPDPLHAGYRNRSRERADTSRGGRRDESRRAAARVRRGAHAPRLAHRTAVRLLGPPAVDRRSNPRPRQRARRVLLRGQQPDRCEARPERDTRGGLGAHGT